MNYLLWLQGSGSNRL